MAGVASGSTIKGMCANPGRTVTEISVCPATPSVSYTSISG
jgi:hypothetical protein